MSEADGYLRISNDFFEALCRLRIPGEASQVFNFIIRKTLGFNKSQDKIALSQFCLGTGLTKDHVIRARSKLVEMNLISVAEKGNDGIVIYIVNKDFLTWRSLPKRATLLKKATLLKREISFAEKGNASLPKREPTKDNATKDTLTKNNIPLRESEESKPPVIAKPKRETKTNAYLQIFLDEWAVKYGRPYVVGNYAQAGGAAKTVEAKVRDPVEFTNAVRAYLAATDRRIVDGGHSFNFFIFEVNRWVLAGDGGTNGAHLKKYPAQGGSKQESRIFRNLEAIRNYGERVGAFDGEGFHAGDRSVVDIVPEHGVERKKLDALERPFTRSNR